jgi:hypothetical protein
MAQSEDPTEMQPQPGLEARLFSSPVQLVDFVREGWTRLSGKEGEKGLQPEIIRSDDFFLNPAFQTGTTILLPSILAVVGIHDILVRIRIRGSVPLTNASGSDSRSDSFL